MAHVSLYRKYRSQTFEDLVGQDHVVKTIQSGLATGRISHAYLFTGPRGTGKTSTARLLAKALCCSDGPRPDPDPNDPICQEISAGTFIDVLEMDAASESGVDDIREKIVEIVEYKPMVARYKVFIIDEVHDLSSKAFDALLKTVEEPPDHIVFILATTEFNKVPSTIRSRCQKYEFHRASLGDLMARLEFVAKAEGIEAEPRALNAIARMADGGYRDALTLLEQAILTADGPITIQQVYDQLGLVSEETVDALLLAMKSANVPALIETLDGVAQRGRDPRAVLESMLHRLTDLTRASYQLDSGSLDAAREAALHEMATQLGRDSILKFRGFLANAHRVIREITLPRIWLESELIRASEVVREPERPPAPPTARPEAKPPPKSLQETAADALQKVKPSEPAPPIAPPSSTPADVWKVVVAKVEAKYPGKRVSLALLGSHVESLEENRLSVQIGRQMDLEYLTDQPARLGQLQTWLSESGGSGWSLHLVSVKRALRDEETKTVELALEGDKLEQLVTDVFNLGDPAKHS